MPMMILKIDWR